MASEAGWSKRAMSIAESFVYVPPSAGDAQRRRRGRLANMIDAAFPDYDKMAEAIERTNTLLREKQKLYCDEMAAGGVMLIDEIIGELRLRP